MIQIGINKEDKLVVRFPYDKTLVELMHELPNRVFNDKTKLWELPILDLPILRDIIEPYVTRFHVKPTLSETAKNRYFQILQEHKYLVGITQKTDSDYEVVGLKSSVKLYPFQKVGAEYLEHTKRALLAFWESK